MAYDRSLNRLTVGILYFNGNNTFGKVEEINLPDVVAKMIDHKVSGMNGTMELPTGLDKMTSSFKTNGPFKEIIAAAMDIWSVNTFMFRGNLENYIGGERGSQVPYVLTYRGTFKGGKGGDIKQHENIDLMYNINVTYMKLEINGVAQYEIDIINNVHKVLGVDLLATQNRNLGL